MNKLAYVIPALLVMQPLAAAAQSAPEFNATVTLGYTSTTLNTTPDVSLNSITLSMASDLTFSDSFSVGLDFDYFMGSIDTALLPPGVDIDADVLRFGIEPVYHMPSGFRVGAYMQHFDVDVSVSPLPITFGVDVDSYGILAGYDGGAFDIEGFIGVSDIDLAGVDVTDYGVVGSYEVAPNLNVFGRVSQTNISAAGGDADVTLYGIGADYTFGNGLAVYGALGQADLSITGVPFDLSSTQYSIGMSYDVGSSAGTRPVVVNVEYARNDLDLGPAPDQDLDQWTIGVTIPLGPNASSMPLNTRGRALGGDYRSSIAAAGFAGLF